MNRAKETVLIEMARKLCQKFVDKVESNRARSIETYADCCEWLAALKIAKDDQDPITHWWCCGVIRPIDIRCSCGEKSE